MNRNWILAFGVLVIAGIGAVFLFGRHGAPSVSTPAPSGVLHIVAAENFWGSIVLQIGGTHVQVMSIVTDPNADPHEYESNTTDARAIADADYVVVNGAGYDSWMDKLLSAGASNQKRAVLNAADFLGKKEGDNPHFWYNPVYVTQVSQKIEGDLIAMDPTDAGYYQQQYAALQSSLAGYQNQIATIKQQYAGVTVGATEDIFVYLSDATGLDLISPQAFILAVGEGNDPPAASVSEFQNQLQNKEIKVLVYNEQTVTPVTERMKKIAADQGIPIVGITETMVPADGKFQDWMSGEMTALANALKGATGK